MLLLRNFFTLVKSLRSIIVVVFIYLMLFLYGILISFSLNENFPKKVFFGVISFSLFMFLPILYQWIVISAKKTIDRFNS